MDEQMRRHMERQARELEDDLRHCRECGALCDGRVPVCECDPAICPLPPAQGWDRSDGSRTGG